MGRVRLEVWNPEGTHHLVARRGGPAVKVRRSREASISVLTEAAKAQLNLDLVFLRDADDGVVTMESLSPSADAAPPRGLSWEPVERPRLPANGTPWTSPGWFGQILPIVDRELAHQGIERCGRPIQKKHGELAAVLRLPTRGGDVWFKIVPPAFGGEGPVIAWLAGLAPGKVPNVLASGPNWWISEEFPPESDDPRDHPFERLAQLQMETIDQTDALLQRGCPYRGLDQLRLDLDALTQRSDLLEPRQVEALAAALPRVEAVCQEAEAMDLPYTLVHGDFRSNNVRWTGDDWFIFDWTDACVAHPFVDMEDRDFDSWGDETSIFVTAWSAVKATPAEQIHALAGVLCAAHRCATFQRIIDSVGRPTADPIVPLLVSCIDRLIARV